MDKRWVAVSVSDTSQVLRGGSAFWIESDSLRRGMLPPEGAAMLAAPCTRALTTWSSTLQVLGTSAKHVRCNGALGNKSCLQGQEHPVTEANCVGDLQARVPRSAHSSGRTLSGNALHSLLASPLCRSHDCGRVLQRRPCELADRSAGQSCSSTLHCFCRTARNGLRGV